MPLKRLIHTKRHLVTSSLQRQIQWQVCSVRFVATTERLHQIVQSYTWRRQLEEESRSPMCHWWTSVTCKGNPAVQPTEVTWKGVETVSNNILLCAQEAFAFEVLQVAVRAGVQTEWQKQALRLLLWTLKENRRSCDGSTACFQWKNIFHVIGILLLQYIVYACGVQIPDCAINYESSFSELKGLHAILHQQAYNPVISYII